MKQNLFGQRSRISLAVAPVAAAEPPAQPTEAELMLASAGDDLGTVDDYAVKMYRSQAMAAVIEFARNGDGSYGEFEELALGIADLDDDGEIQEGEEPLFNDVLGLMADSLISLGASSDAVVKFIGAETGDDDAGEELVFALNDKLANADDDELITGFMAGGEMMLAATTKVIRNGKVKLIKKKVKKRRISSAQRAALKKARSKAHGAGARMARKKSMRLRKSKGLK